MMSIYKDEIYHFAETNMIPYVYDSTPKWSERGKKRDTLIPFLNKFDPRIINGLEHLSNHIRSVHIVYDEFIKNLITFKIMPNDKKNG